jgi:hypothetical protein
MPDEFPPCPLIGQYSPAVVNPATRRLLGLAALALIGGGVVVFVWGSDETAAGVLIRVGAMLGAAWLVAPLLRRPSVASIALLVAGTLVVLRPRLIVAVTVAAVLWRLSSRRRVSG